MEARVITTSRPVPPADPAVPATELAGLRRRERIVTSLVWLCRALVVVVPLALWQYLSDERIIPRFLFSSPEAVWERLVEWTLDGTILSNASFTLMNAFLGYFLGLFIGVALAVLFTVSPRLGGIFIPFLTMINAIPRIAFAPLLVAWFGFGLASNIALVVLVIVFVNFFAAYGGLSAVDEGNLLWAKALGASQWQVWTTVRLPAIGVWVLSSLRMCIGLALSAAIVSEFVGGARGIGYLASSSTNTFKSAGVYAAITVTIVVAGLLDVFLRMAERRMSQWSAHV
ncbi:ABC transporter permease [Actinophytocola algeriensis]|uniref:NitT/TauT family transport system permease protein n=1 Tax=Actinophytocola algeriensis TaxID=1768010 RepID=A0A7W7QFQ4_9PSEU|nr:ABC transporter permease [Actinophytocola algeriensis]MBB4912251.1 NitT/TauT family transport system permease protein [Actinophytocola algeriensis]